MQYRFCLRVKVKTNKTPTKKYTDKMSILFSLFTFNINRIIHRPSISLLSKKLIDSLTPLKTFHTYNIPTGFQSLKLINEKIIANNTKILSFELPKGVENLTSLRVPSGIKVKKEVLPGLIHDKSYSPVSLPSKEKQVDIIVKRYHSPDSSFKGLGEFLCNDLKVGESVDIKFKPIKLFVDEPYEANRFENLIFIGNGTGIAPLYQMALHILEDDLDDKTNIYFISAHRSEKDILLGTELNHLYDKYCNTQFKLNKCILSNPAEEKNGRRMGMADLVDIPLPKSIDDTKTSHVVVCGTDGFLETVCGMTSFVYEADGTKHKQQGELTGLLQKFGFENKDCVTKL